MQSRKKMLRISKSYAGIEAENNKETFEPTLYMLRSEYWENFKDEELLRNSK